MNELKVDILIIGSGPAGYTAAIYTSRAGLKTLLYKGDQPGGQLTITSDVENYPGYPDGVMGPEMMIDFEKQAGRFGAEIKSGMVSSVDFSSNELVAFSDSNEKIIAKSVIISTGASAKWLNLESEQRLNGKGVSACAVCDGFFFRGQDVAVVGGGDTAAEEALYLSNICSKVHLIHRRDKLRAEQILQDRIFEKQKEGKIEIHWNSQLKEVLGDDNLVSGILLDSGTQIDLNGVFIAIGHKPNTDIFENQLVMENGYIKVNSGLSGNATQTSIEGVFASGDVADSIYRQAVTSAGSGCMAALDAQKYLEENF